MTRDLGKTRDAERRTRVEFVRAGRPAAAAALVLGVWLAARGPSSEAAGAARWRVTVEAGAHARRDVAVSFVLPADAEGGEWRLRDDRGREVPMQINGHTAEFMVDRLAAGARRIYRMEPGRPTRPAALEVTAVREPGGVRLAQRGRPVLRYQAEPAELRADVKPVYRRGGYIHPVYTPGGRRVTDDYPANHVHHHGVWFAWTRTEFEGRKPDFWNMGDGTGTVEFESVDKAWSGAVHGGFRAFHRHLDLSGGGPREALGETWEVTLRGTTERSPRHFAFDVVSRQETAGKAPLRLLEYHYGGLGVRGHMQWNGKDNAWFLTSEGKTRADGHGTRARWCHIGGLVDGAPVGIAILGHPENLRAPQPMRIHPTEPFFSYAPAQLGDFEIAPGATYVSRYRFVVHDGPADAVELNRLWNDYAEPPVVAVMREGFADQPTPARGWQALFNGKDLAGWHTHGRERWLAEHGEILGQGQTGAEGYLATEASYRDFELRARVKAEGPGKGGLFFHSTIDGAGIKGVQVEVDSTPGRSAGGLHETGGRGWLARPGPDAERALRPGDWNEVRAIVRGNRIATWVNGVPAVDFTDPAPRYGDGVVALQLESGGQARLRFKDVWIRELRGLDITWVDVEGGAATLIATPAGESILVDSGWPGPRDAERIRQAAEAAGLARIDHLITTHWHRDHFGGLAELLQRLPVGLFWDHGFPPGEPRDILPELKATYLRVTEGRSTMLRPGHVIPLRQAPDTPQLELRVVASRGLAPGENEGAAQTRACRARPEHPALPDDESDNFRSVGFVLSYGAFDFLDLGDLTWNTEHKLACPRNAIGSVDVFQVTHHGADDSNNPALVRAVAPEVAVVNNGPRKGGRPEVHRLLREVAGPADVFQLHRNVETGPEDNAPPAQVANDAEDCRGEWVRVAVDREARTYTVELPAKGTRRTYEVR